MSLISYRLDSSREFEFLLLLLKNTPDSILEVESLIAKGISWDALGKSIILPYLNLKLEKLPKSLSIPKQFRKVASRAFHKNSLVNNYRLTFMKRTFHELNEKGVEILFLKGAAEILNYHHSPEYLGARSMGDIDFVCKESDYLQVHKYLIESGNIYLDQESKKSGKREVLEMTGHYTYNTYSPRLLEMHVDSYMFKHQQDNYPPEFAKKIFERKRKITVNKADFFIPSYDDLLIYLICHAAGEKDYKHLCNKRFHIYDNCISKKAKIMEKINNRFNSHQALFLYQLDLFLSESHAEIDFDYVLSELKKIKQKKLIEHHLELIHFYTDHDFFNRTSAYKTKDAFLHSTNRHLTTLLVSQTPLLLFKLILKEKFIFKLKAFLIKFNILAFQKFKMLFKK